MKSFQEFLIAKGEMIEEKKQIQKAIDPERKGYCTPMSKEIRTPARKALAKRFKRGGDLYKAGE